MTRNELTIGEWLSELEKLQKQNSGGDGKSKRELAAQLGVCCKKVNNILCTANEMGRLRVTIGLRPTLVPGRMCKTPLYSIAPEPKKCSRSRSSSH